MKKNNKGFTLVELIAVIVVIAIIALIIMPIIQNTVNDARSGAAEDSAYGYIDSVDKYVVKQLKDNDEFELNGKYTVSNGNLGTYNITFKGTIPTGGTLIYEENVLKSGCLTIDNYKVIIDSQGIAYTNLGECSDNDVPGYILTTNIPVARTIDNVKYYEATWINTNSIYYNPISGNFCSDYHEDNSNIGYNGITNSVSTKTSNNNGCLKWYAYSENLDGTVNMILDHSTSIGAKWSKTFTNQVRPEPLLSALQNDTSGWTGVPTRSDKYTPELYKGTSNEWNIDYTGYKTRLITAQEVANIVGKENWNEKTSYCSTRFSFGSLSSTNYSNQTDEQKARQRSYSWLFDNLYYSDSYGGTTSQANSGNYAYWTSSPSCESPNYVWVVYHEGSLICTGPSTSTDAVRPIITISKI